MSDGATPLFFLLLTESCWLHLWTSERPSHRPGEREGVGGRPLRGVKSQGRRSRVKRKSFLLAESHLSFSSNGAAICQSGREGRGQQVSAAAAVPRGPGLLEIWLRGPNRVVGLFTVSPCPPTLNGGDERRVSVVVRNRVSPGTRPAGSASHAVRSGISHHVTDRSDIFTSDETLRKHLTAPRCLFVCVWLLCAARYGVDPAASEVRDSSSGSGEESGYFNIFSRVKGHKMPLILKVTPIWRLIAETN